MTPRLKQSLSSLLFIWILLLAGNAFSQNYPDGYARTYEFIEKVLFPKLNEWSDASLGDVTKMSEAEKEFHKNKILTKMVFIMNNTINNSNTNVKISDEICNVSSKKWWSFYTDLVDWELPFKCDLVSAELKGRHEDGLWYYVTYNINYTYHKDPSAKKHYTGTMTSDFVKKNLIVHDYMYITCTEYETKLDKVADKLPEGVEKWNVNEKNNYLTFTAQLPNSSVGIIIGKSNDTDIEFSTDEGLSWQTMANEDSIILKNIGDKIYVRGNNPDGFSFGNTPSMASTFKMTGKIAASGSVMSLIDGKGKTLTIPMESCFYKLFFNCGSLSSAPELPATELKACCYEGMFYGCSGLTIAPKLPAMNLEGGCYWIMFKGCTSLTSAPELPATKLANMCYYNMFDGCTSLTSAPELPATNLAGECYEGMFEGCTSLKSIKVHFSDWKFDPDKKIYYNPTGEWLKDVAPNGTFYCPRALPMEFDINHIPERWTVKYID